ncbi:MAG: tRNA pseudouridine(13) synthase TruD, partial [Nanoarchaeota archaeon]|nr:tRNA pseudouridine(13) synthase TruD [Nanoarchaeota archaeon]
IGKFKGRINLGDNLGNNFVIVVRDLVKEDVLLAKENLNRISSSGVWNYFDEQRFGYAKNSHIVGRYLLLGEIEKALKEILCSCPPNPSEDLKLYTNFLNENWNRIVAQDEKIVDEIKEIVPKFLTSDLHIIRHLIRAKNDFYGAFRNIPKKIRTLYVNAYQSYVFNEMLAKFSEGSLSQEIPEELELVNLESDLNAFGGDIVKKILENDNLSLDNFKLAKMPELRLCGIKRKVKIFPSDLKFSLGDCGNDDLNEGKLKLSVTFSLGPGEYATNVVKQLFGQRDSIIK